MEEAFLAWDGELAKNPRVFSSDLGGCMQEQWFTEAHWFDLGAPHLVFPSEI